MSQEQAQQTGTRNETYDVIAVLYHALQGAENCQRYVQDSQNEQARNFFEQALEIQRQLADQGKQVLQQVLQQDTGGGSAFGWSQQGQGSSSGQSQGMSQESQFTSASPTSSGGGDGGF